MSGKFDIRKIIDIPIMVVSFVSAILIWHYGIEILERTFGEYKGDKNIPVVHSIWSILITLFILKICEIPTRVVTKYTYSVSKTRHLPIIERLVIDTMDGLFLVPAMVFFYATAAVILYHYKNGDILSNGISAFVGGVIIGFFILLLRDFVFMKLVFPQKKTNSVAPRDIRSSINSNYRRVR